MPPTGTPDLLSRGRQTRITVDYKFIIESPCERDRSAAYPCRCPPPYTYTRLARGIFSRTRFRGITKMATSRICPPSNSNQVGARDCRGIANLASVISTVFWKVRAV